MVLYRRIRFFLLTNLTTINFRKWCRYLNLLMVRFRILEKKNYLEF